MHSHFRWQALTLVAGIAAMLALQSSANEKEPVKNPAAKLDLTTQSMPRLFALVRPQENEWRHLKVQWITDVTAARQKAAKEDKPIVVLYTGGAGYNEPLGLC